MPRRLSDYVICRLANGATALVVCGTTGEAPTLSPAEHRELIRIAVAQARGRIPVIAGAGANTTEHAIELTRDAEATGADAALSVVPYYNKPTQSGLYAHFRAIAQSTGLPIILYDAPSRTACGLADETVARLAELPRIIGLASRMRRPMRAGRRDYERWSGQHSAYCAVMMAWRCPTSRRVATAAFRWPQTLPRASAATCSWPGNMANPFALSALHSLSQS